MRNLTTSFGRFYKWWLWLLPLVFLGVFFVTPLTRILALAFSKIQTNTFSSSDLTYLSQVLGFTLFQALLSTLLTLVLGLPAAYLFARVKFTGRSFLLNLTTLPFILPTVVVAAGFNALLGPHGWINLLLMNTFGLSAPPVNFLNTLGAILLAHVFYNTTIIIRMVGGAWGRLNERIEQAGSVLGASPFKNFIQVIFPMLKQSILAACILVFLFDFTSFGVILLLGGPQFTTLEVSIYTQAMQLLNLPLAGLTSVVQLGFSLVVLAISARFSDGQNVSLLPQLNNEGIHQPKTLRQKLFVIVMVTLLLVLLVAPMAALVTRSFVRLEADRGERGQVSTGLTLDYYIELFYNRSDSIFYVPPIQAASNSLGYALVTMLLSVGIGVLLVYGARQNTAAEKILGSFILLPLGTSAVTLGLGFVVTFNQPPFDISSFPMLIPIAHSLIALPFVVRTVQPALTGIPLSLRQAASVLGASPVKVWWNVELPILMRSGFAGAVFAFTISLGEFGAASFLVRPDAPTLPVAIYRFLSQPGALNYGQGLAIASMLMILCAAGLFLIEKISTSL